MYDNLTSDSIKREIILNAMSGEKYITEAELCTRTGLSRTKLRETLKALDGNGMIERKQKCGVTLRHYSREELEELFDLRLMLESRAVDKTVANASKEDLLELQELDRGVIMAAKENNHMEAVRKDSLFHRKLIQISGNKITLKVTDGLQLIESTMKIHTRNKLPDKRDPYTHADIIEAIRNRDIKKCRELLVNHIKWVARKTLSNLDENPN
jgi:DNA-binding GntR family transcriptional regulator